MASISIKNITKDFPVGDEVIRVLNNVSAEIQKGELTMLVGPSGCGKTTLISIISGIMSATEGQIILDDYHLSKMSDTQNVLFRRKNIGFIFQQYNLLPALTASENAAMPLLAAGVLEKEAVDSASKILEQIGMAGHTEKLPSQLSGGQQQRVAIARALVHNPKLIVCDEPTAALDAKSGQAVMQILRDIATQKDRTVLIVTHDNRIFHFADRVLEMSDGRIIGSYSGESFMKKGGA
ncbi:MAG: transporter related [Candidatus Midichloriaceae bacterium]|jgi:putative ABC transport system ATP-binding protein|nr:transporter related [Candidatus Midichloriaceae bacterium]